MITEESARKLMKERGYSFVALFENKGERTGLEFVKEIDGVKLYAKVWLNAGSVTLYFADLKYFCQLSADKFQFDHPSFEKYEQVLCMYVAKCLDVEVDTILKSLRPVRTEEAPKELKGDRKKKLGSKIVAVGKSKGYPKEMCTEFYNYWTEMNEGGKKMRFEMEKIFDVARRLQTWLLHDKKWSKTFVEKKAEKQDQDIKKSTTINKEELF